MASSVNKMTVQDVIVLLEVGYDEASILQEIAKRGMTGKFALKPEQVLQLRKAGATPQLLKSMGIFVAPKPVFTAVSFAELKTWLEQKKQTEWIRQQLEQRGLRSEQFVPSAILELRKLGMPMDLLRLVVQLRSRTTQPPADPSTPTGKPPTSLPTQEKPHPPQPTDLFAPPKPATPPVERQVTPPPVERPTAALPEVGKWGVRKTEVKPLTERERNLMKRVSLPVARAVDGIYHHIAKRYQLEVPEGWRILEDINPDSGLLTVYFTPDKSLSVAQLQQGIWIALEYISRDNRDILNRSLLQMARYLIQRYLLIEPGISEKTPLKSGKFHNREVVSIDLEGKARLEEFSLRKRFHLLRLGRSLVQVGVFAQPDNFEKFATQADGVLQKLQLRDETQIQRGQRLKREITQQQAIQQNMNAVVSIMAMQKKDDQLKPAGAGTGFVVTVDGYVLTNHHVAVNAETNQPYDVYMLNWDQSTGRKNVRARYVAGYMQQDERARVRMVDAQTGRISSRFQRQHVDIALLKIIDPGVYPTVTLSSVHHVSLGDRVVAMGFPTEGSGINTMGTDSITTTVGDVSRLERMYEGQVNEIQHSAKVAGGNSGGPLINIHTGAVIGINTWVGIFDKRLPRPAMGLGYYYALPIDLAWQFFPDFIDPDASKYSIFQWYELGMKWMAEQQWDPAKRAFANVLRQQPGMIAAYMQIANIYLALADKHNDDRRNEYLKVARRWSDNGLRLDLEHTGLMQALARVAIESKEWTTAEYLLKQVIEKSPYDWQLYLFRGLMHNQQKKYDLALADASQVIRLAGQLLPIGHILRGAILYSQEKYFEGQQAYRQAMQSDASSLEAKIGEAMGYAHLKQFDDAIHRLEQLAKQHKYEPMISQNLLLALVLKADRLRAWNAFDHYIHSCTLRHVEPDAISLFLGGALTDVGVPEKYRERVQWGLWGQILSQHSQSEIAPRAGVMLAALAIQKGYRGLAYGIFRQIPSNIEDAELKKQYEQLRKVILKRGISKEEILFAGLNTVPRWSPTYIWKLFYDTPSLFDLETAKALASQGFAVPILLQMLRLSQIRQKQGVDPSGDRSTPQAQPDSSSNNELLNRQRPVITQVAYAAFQALKTGNAELWLSIHDPTGNRDNYLQTFWQLVQNIRSGQVGIRSYNPPKITFHEHPTYKVIAHFHVQTQINQQIQENFMRLRVHNNRWVMF
jgi:S1-C subfamily serine protease/predicted negative regulator of RcsB-dependent stress response